MDQEMILNGSSRSLSGKWWTLYGQGTKICTGSELIEEDDLPKVRIRDCRAIKVLLCKFICKAPVSSVTSHQNPLFMKWRKMVSACRFSSSLLLITFLVMLPNTRLSQGSLPMPEFQWNPNGCSTPFRHRSAITVLSYKNTPNGSTPGYMPTTA